MSIQGTGHHIHGGDFYNVRGDVNLQSHHHLTIQDHYATFQRTEGSTWRLEDHGTSESHHQMVIQDPELHEAAFQSSMGSNIDGRAAGSEREWAGVSRNSRHVMETRPVPYGEPGILRIRILF